MKIWRGAAGVESHCRHTLQPTLLLLPNTCASDSSTPWHTLMFACTHTHIKAAYAHIHTHKTHKHTQQICAWQTHAQIWTHAQHARHSAAEPKDPTHSLKHTRAHTHTRRHTGKKKNRFPSTAYLCKPLQARTALIQSAATTVTLGHLNVFCFFVFLPWSAKSFIHIIRRALWGAMHCSEISFRLISEHMPKMMWYLMALNACVDVTGYKGAY